MSSRQKIPTSQPLHVLIIMVMAFGGAISLSSVLCHYHFWRVPYRFTVFRSFVHIWQKCFTVVFNHVDHDSLRTCKHTSECNILIILYTVGGTTHAQTSTQIYIYTYLYTPTINRERDTRRLYTVCRKTYDLCISVCKCLPGWILCCGKYVESLCWWQHLNTVWLKQRLPAGELLPCKTP